MHTCVMNQVLAAFLLVMTLAASPAAGDEVVRWRTLERQRDTYRSVLGTVREEHGGVRRLPAVDFFLFGMGERTKFVYCGGRLTRALTGEVVKAWEATEEVIVPPAYTVALRTKAGSFVFLTEDEEGVWVEEGGKKNPLSMGSVSLPTFADHRQGLVLRVLHQELLINVVDGRPVPNLFVYPKPWYRDGAMMAMAFEQTGNLHLPTHLGGQCEPGSVRRDEPSRAGVCGAENLRTTYVACSRGVSILARRPAPRSVTAYGTFGVLVEKNAETSRGTRGGLRSKPQGQSWGVNPLEMQPRADPLTHSDALERTVFGRRKRAAA